MTALARSSVSALRDRVRRSRGVVAACLTGLVLRLVWAAYAARPPQGLHDPVRYLLYGQSIAAGHGYRDPFSGQFTSYYPPGYPWFVGAVTWVTKHVVHIGVPRAVAIAQALLGAALIVLVGYVAHRIAGPRAAVVAAWLVALWPSLVMYGALVLSETLAMTLLVAAVAVLVRRPWREGIPRFDLLVFGALLGLSALVRPQVLGVLVAAVVVWWLVTRDVRATLARAGWAALAVAVVLAPWFGRNANRMGLFVLSTNTADDLCIGHNDQANGGFLLLEYCATESPAQGLDAEVRHYHHNLDNALSWIPHHPGRELQLLPERAWHLMGDDGGAVSDTQSYGEDPFLDARVATSLSAIANAWYATVMVCAVGGAYVSATRRRPEAFFLVLAVTAVLVLPLAFFGDVRFKAPAFPMTAVLASVAIVRVWDGLSPARTARPAGATTSRRWRWRRRRA